MAQARRLALLLGAGVLLSCGGGPSEPGGSGKLTIAVIGLPGTAAARVVVNGPHGFQVGVAGSTTLRKLDPGTYRFDARYVSAQGQIWLAQLSADSLMLGGRDTDTVTVMYAATAGPAIDLSVAGADLIQSTQRVDGSVPMIAGRSALLGRRRSAVDNRRRSSLGAYAVDAEQPRPTDRTPIAATNLSPLISHGQVH